MIKKQIQEIKIKNNDEFPYLKVIVLPFLIKSPISTSLEYIPNTVKINLNGENIFEIIEDIINDPDKYFIVIDKNYYLFGFEFHIGKNRCFFFDNKGKCLKNIDDAIKSDINLSN